MQQRRDTARIHCFGFVGSNILAIDTSFLTARKIVPFVCFLLIVVCVPTTFTLASAPNAYPTPRALCLGI